MAERLAESAGRCLFRGGGGFVQGYFGSGTANILNVPGSLYEPQQPILSIVSETSHNGGVKAKATYSVKSWNEKTLSQISQEQKITHASVEYAFAGDIHGKASVEYVMYYTHLDPEDQHRATATYTGIIHFSGQVSGKDGSFGMTDQGVFESGAAKSSLRIIEGSGQGALRSIHGKASYHADPKGFVFELDYEL